jgi:hypothetical protein
MATQQIIEINSTPRDRLHQLDALLDDLEDLNLNDMGDLPVRIGTTLMDLGVDDAYTLSITALIDRVFDLQEPVLAAVRSGSALRRASNMA